MSLPKSTRWKILQRDGFRCHYCGRTAKAHQLEVDHITPRAHGGTDTEDNLVTACIPCNRGKRDQTLHLSSSTLVPCHLCGKGMVSDLSAPIDTGFAQICDQCLTRSSNPCHWAFRVWRAHQRELVS